VGVGPTLVFLLLISAYPLLSVLVFSGQDGRAVAGERKWEMLWIRRVGIRCHTFSVCKSALQEDVVADTANRSSLSLFFALY